MSKLAIIIVTWNSRYDLERLLPSLSMINYPAESLSIYFVDNGSIDNSIEIIEQWKANQEYNVTVVKNQENLGFVGGNNQGIEMALAASNEYVLLLNADTEVEDRDWLYKLTAVLEKDLTIGAIQPLILLGDKERINSWGNNIHFLGFGYSGGNTVLLSQYNPVKKEVAYCSGAAVCYRASALRQAKAVSGDYLGEFYFAYHEDLELGHRLRLLGWRNVVLPEASIIHHYRFKADDRQKASSKFFYMERNRYLFILQTYDILTIIFIFLPLLIMELGQWLWALHTGWWKQRISIWPAIFSLVKKKSFWQRRSAIQSSRQVTEREATNLWSGKISYQEIDNPVLTYVVNPCLQLWWSLVRVIMFW
ncbi:MAG: glycosyltransferase family 2 protein [bacterium]